MHRCIVHYFCVFLFLIIVFVCYQYGHLKFLLFAPPLFSGRVSYGVRWKLWTARLLHHVSSGCKPWFDLYTPMQSGLNEGNQYSCISNISAENKGGAWGQIGQFFVATIPFLAEPIFLRWGLSAPIRSLGMQGPSWWLTRKRGYKYRLGKKREGTQNLPFWPIFW